LSQQIPSPPSRLRKSLLILGIAYLVLGFFFFYWASRVDWDYVSTYNDKVNLAYPSPSEYPQFGAYEYYVRNVVMQPNDFLEVLYLENIRFNGTLMTVLVGLNGSGNNTVLTSSGYAGEAFFAGVAYRNGQPNEIGVTVYLIAQNTQNVTLSGTTMLNHYETPQWGYFGIGVALSSLAVVSTVESLNQPKPCRTKGSSTTERGV
jgi:hypothetical protein